jgi:hypothetical protein
MAVFAVPTKVLRLLGERRKVWRAIVSLRTALFLKIRNDKGVVKGGLDRRAAVRSTPKGNKCGRKMNA